MKELHQLSELYTKRSTHFKVAIPYLHEKHDVMSFNGREYLVRLLLNSRLLAFTDLSLRYRNTPQPSMVFLLCLCSSVVKHVPQKILKTKCCSILTSNVASLPLPTLGLSEANLATADLLSRILDLVSQVWVFCAIA